MDGFATYYIEANLVCASVFTILLVHNHFNIDRQEKQIKYDRVLVAFLLYFLADCFWALVVSETIPKTRFTVILQAFLIFVLMAFSIYFWLEYVMAYEQIPHRNRRKNKFAVIFPFLVATVAMIAQYLIAPQTLIDENLDTKYSYALYLISVPTIYMVAILFYTIKKAKQEKTASEKWKHFIVGVFPLVVLGFGVVQLIFPYVPIYCFSVLILMLLFYIQALELRISLDPLTQLNNRSQLSRYISQRSNLAVDGRKTVAIMMDIDGFKAINDTYGHAEGDRALVTVSNTLKKTASSIGIPAFICRYGGDEFILIVHPERVEQTEELIENLRKDLLTASEGSPYELTVSFGYDELTNENETIEDCIVCADKKLYIEKKKKKVGR